MPVKNEPTTTATGGVEHYVWNDMTAEPLKGTITRKLIPSDRMMIAHVYFKKGDDVPLHKHENEQLTYILSGALKFWFGADGQDEITVRAGEGSPWHVHPDEDEWFYVLEGEFTVYVGDRRLSLPAGVSIEIKS